MEQLGIPIGADHGMVDHILTGGVQSRSGLQPAAITKAADISIEVYQATELLLGSDCSKFGKFIKEVQNCYAMGVDKYPKTLKQSYHILQHYTVYARNYQAPINNTSGVMALINYGQGNKKDDTNITFWNCQKKVHYSNDCPYKKTETDTYTYSSRQYGSSNMMNGIRDATVMLQKGVHGGESDGYEIFSKCYFFSARHEPMQPEEEHPHLEENSVVLNQKIQDISKACFIKNSWILLENQSDLNVLYEHMLMKGISKIDSWMYIHCNAGFISTNWVDYFTRSGSCMVPS